MVRPFRGLTNDEMLNIERSREVGGHAPFIIQHSQFHAVRHLQSRPVSQRSVH